MDNIKSLEREVELLKEILELKTKLLECERGFTYPNPIPYWPKPYIGDTPNYIPYKVTYKNYGAISGNLGFAVGYCT